MPLRNGGMFPAWSLGRKGTNDCPSKDHGLHVYAHTQDLPTQQSKAWLICDLGSSLYHVEPSLPPSKVRTLLGIQLSGICFLSYILMREEQGHHYRTAFLVFLFTLMIYCGRERTTSQSLGKFSKRYRPALDP